jgi:hypothetical protein
MTGFRAVPWFSSTTECGGPIQMKSLPTTRAVALATSVMIMTALLSCQPRNGLVQETLPAESAVVDIMGTKTARVRSIYCDIMVEPLDAAGWGRLAKASVYRKNLRRPVFRRTPPLTAFLVILKNTVNAPIRLEKAHILGAGSGMEALTAERISTRFRSTAYSWWDFGRMLSLRRLVTEPESLKKIDIDGDTIETKLDFIPPQDHVITIIAFDRLPVEIRKYKLGFSVAAMGTVREITIEFNRNEYRSENKKQKEAGDDYDE